MWLDVALFSPDTVSFAHPSVPFPEPGPRSSALYGYVARRSAASEDISRSHVPSKHMNVMETDSPVSQLQVTGGIQSPIHPLPPRAIRLYAAIALDFSPASRAARHFRSGDSAATGD